MAKTETKNLERTYNIPLRKEFLKVPKWKRTKKAVAAAKEFLQKHMKSEDVKLGKHLNEELWKHGIKNPPHHIKVTVQKDSKGVVKAELFGHKIEEKKKEEKKKSKLQEIAKKAGMKLPAKDDKSHQSSSKAETKEEKKEDKKTEKQETKEEKASEKKEAKPEVKKEVKTETKTVEEK